MSSYKLETVLKCSNCGAPLKGTQCDYCGYSTKPELVEQSKEPDSIQPIDPQVFSDFFVGWNPQSIFSVTNLGVILACGIMGILAGFIFVRLGGLHYFGLPG